MSSRPTCQTQSHYWTDPILPEAHWDQSHWTETTLTKGGCIRRIAVISLTRGRLRLKSSAAKIWDESLDLRISNADCQWVKVPQKSEVIIINLKWESGIFQLGCLTNFRKIPKTTSTDNKQPKLTSTSSRKSWPPNPQSRIKDPSSTSTWTMDTNKSKFQLRKFSSATMNNARTDICYKKCSRLWNDLLCPSRRPSYPPPSSSQDPPHHALKSLELDPQALKEAWGHRLPDSEMGLWIAKQGKIQHFKFKSKIWSLSTLCSMSNQMCQKWMNWKNGKRHKNRWSRKSRWSDTAPPNLWTRFGSECKAPQVRKEGAKTNDLLC